MSYVVINEVGPPCPRCGRSMQIREHGQISAKQLRGPYYYRRWFHCLHKDCRTSTVVWDQFKVHRDAKDTAQERRLKDIFRQLRPRD